MTIPNWNVRVKVVATVYFWKNNRIDSIIFSSLSEHKTSTSVFSECCLKQIYCISTPTSCLSILARTSDLPLLTHSSFEERESESEAATIHKLKRKTILGINYPFSARYLAAGEFLAIDPAGEMWSVVTESPRLRRTRASTIGLISGNSEGRKIDTCYSLQG